MAHRDLFAPTWGKLFDLPHRGDYTYFRGGSANFLRRYADLGPDRRFRSAAAFAAEASMLAYQRWGDDVMPDADFFGVWDGFDVHCLATGGPTGTAGYFTACDDFAFLVFRGTEHDDPRDFATDSAFLPVAEPGDAFPALALQAWLTPGMKVHMGFQTAIDSVWAEVFGLLAAYRARHPSSEILFTGHSLGSALATLALSRFDGSNVSLYTFGSPRVGNDAFAGQLDAKADLGIYRFVNRNDLVTHVPPEDFGYRHTRPWMYHIDDEWEIRQLEEAPVSDWRELADFLAAMKRGGIRLDPNEEVPACLLDHSPVRYTARLWDWMDRGTTPPPGIDS